MTDVLGIGIANICYVLNPEIVVLGGGIMSRKEYLLPRIQAGLKSIFCRQSGRKPGSLLRRTGTRQACLGLFFYFMARH